MNCYRKYGFVQAEQNDAEEEHDELSFTVNTWDRLAGAFEADNVTPFDEYIEADNSADGLTVSLTDNAIVDMLCEESSAQSDSNGDDDVAHEPRRIPSSAEAHKSLNTLRRYALASGSSACAEEIMTLATRIETLLIREMTKV